MSYCIYYLYNKDACLENKEIRKLSYSATNDNEAIELGSKYAKQLGIINYDIYYETGEYDFIEEVVIHQEHKTNFQFLKVKK